MAKANVRERLLDAGLETLHRRGFNGCGVQEITEAAGVPKGSFYNHFESKEAMAAKMAKRGYTGGCLIGNLCAELSDQSKLVSDHLAAVFAGWTEAVETCI